MADGDNNVLIDVEQILSELDKISQLQIETKVVKGQVKDVENNIVEIREHVGLDDNDAKKNIIGKDKLPTTLSINEKLRYINIGKNFVLGAGAEFQKIQKAIRFKEQMSTTKNEFLEKIDKIKDKVQKAKSSNGFWKTLLKVSLLLGTIVYLWKTKIQDNLPNLSNIVDDSVDKVKNFMKNSVGNIFDYVSGGMSESFNYILKDMVTVYLPNILNTFFTVTLPTSLVNTYLAVLSGFSSDAEHHLDKRLKDNMEKTSEALTDAALNEVREMDTRLNTKDAISAATQAFTVATNVGYGFATVAELQMMQRNSAYLAAFQEKNSQLFASVDNAAKGLLKNNTSIIELAKKGRMDMNIFLAKVNEFQKTNGLTNAEVIKAVADAMNVDVETISQTNLTNLEQEFGAVKGINSLIDSQRNLSIELQEHITKIKQDDERKRKEYQENLDMYKPIHIDVSKVLEEAQFKHIGDALKKITDFLRDENTKEGKLHQIVSEGMKGLGDFYEKYFSASISLVRDSFEKIGKLFHVSPSVQDKKETPVVPQQTYSGNNIIVNIEMSAGQQNTIGALLNEVGNVQGDIIGEIQKSNSQLMGVIEALKSVGSLHSASKQFIEQKNKELSDKVDKKEAFVWTYVNANRKDITDLKNNLYVHLQHPTDDIMIPLTMTICS